MCNECFVESRSAKHNGVNVMAAQPKSNDAGFSLAVGGSFSRAFSRANFEIASHPGYFWDLLSVAVARCHHHNLHAKSDDNDGGTKASSICRGFASGGIARSRGIHVPKSDSVSFRCGKDMIHGLMVRALLTLLLSQQRHSTRTSRNTQSGSFKSSLSTLVIFVHEECLSCSRNPSDQVVLQAQVCQDGEYVEPRRHHIFVWKRTSRLTFTSSIIILPLLQIFTRSVAAFCTLALLHSAPAKAAAAASSEQLHVGQKIANYFRGFGIPDVAILAIISALARGGTSWCRTSWYLDGIAFDDGVTGVHLGKHGSHCTTLVLAAQ